jgi:hypothetical protein
LYLDPLDGNPSSYVGVEKVLDHILEQFPGRTFVPLCMDGSPLQIIYELLRDEKTGKKYEKIIPLPGVGHEQMNMMSSYFDLIWPFWMPEFCESHGLKKETQQNKFLSVWDTHKCTDALQIMLEGMIREQMKEYLAWCEIHHLSSSLKHFLKVVELRWVSPPPPPPPPPPPSPFLQHVSPLLTPSTPPTPSFAWLSPLLLPGLEILAFIHGTRHCQIDLIHAARVSFLKVWFTHSHPKYRLCISSFIRELSVMPSFLSETIQRWTIGSNTGNDGNFQGADFVGEEHNRTIKGGSSIFPDYNKWKKIIRLAPLMKNLRKELERDTKPKPKDTKESSKIRMQPDVISWRGQLRRTTIFQKPWQTMTGKEAVAVDVLQKATIQKQIYIEKEILTWKKVGGSLPQISYFAIERKKTKRKS